MEIQLNITANEYQIIKQAIRHEINENSYMIASKDYKNMPGMMAQLKEYSNRLSVLNRKMEEAYNDTLRRCPAVNEMA